jgi:transposase-like protein
MGDVEITVDSDILTELLFGDRQTATEKLIQSVFNEVMEAEMTEHLQAERGEETDDRQGYRNGHYKRSLTMSVGTLELKVPRDRAGEFDTAIFDRYERNEQALVLAMMEMVVNGVSTRKVSRITEKLCGKEFSQSTVSRLTEKLNEQVDAWCNRKLKDEYPFLMVDAMQIRVRRNGQVTPTSALITIGVNEDGHREILGVRIANSESGEAWKANFQWLKSRGLEGVEYVVSDAHEGLVDAVHQYFQGACWQRCQTHFKRNILDKTPSKLKDELNGRVDEVLKADTPDKARTAFRRLANDFEDDAGRAVDCLEAGLEDAIQVLHLPDKYRRRLRTTNSCERLIQEIRRRERVIRIFPHDESAWRLIGAYLAEQHEEWSTGRRYFDMTEYNEWKQSNTEQKEYSAAAE